MFWGYFGEYYDFEFQWYDDGYFEVIGFIMMFLVVLQVGGYGEWLMQCCEVVFIMFKVILVQVDGEFCKFVVLCICIVLCNQVIMVQKVKWWSVVFLYSDQQLVFEQLCIQVSCVSMYDYEVLYYDKEQFKEVFVLLGIVVVLGDSDLEFCCVYIERL